MACQSSLLSTGGFRLCLPSLCELEGALSRVQSGKAVGHDRIPPKLCKHNAAALARLSYAQLLKLAVHGQEAITHKGGQLFQAHEGEGPVDSCESCRSLLISSHQGKVLHRSLGQHQADLYGLFLQHQQIGGRRRAPVTLGLHLLRSYMRHHALRRCSAAILFLDLRAAFYRVLRPLTLDSSWTDAEIAGLAQRLQLDPGTVADLFAHLRAPSATASANHHVRNYLSALHSDTWFCVEGQHDLCRTSVGSRHHKEGRGRALRL